MSIGPAYFNPYELTASQIEAARSQDLFRARHRRPLRQRLQLSDQLMGRVERCRMESVQLVSAELWQETVTLAAEVDPGLRRQLGTDRRPDHLGEILFRLQARLLEEINQQRSRGDAPVIPLFPDR
ncbi:MAG: hypothetical protein ACYCX9_12370 [Candidatus Dormibacteria bacterium]